MAVQEGRDPLIVGVLKDGLHAQAVRSRSNQIFVRSLTKDERKCSKNDGFSRAGLSGDGDESRALFPRSFLRPEPGCGCAAR